MGAMFTHHVGVKFHPDNSVKRFPGNTIICFVADGTPVMDALLDMRRTLEAMASANHIAFLPPSSYHMTTFELLTDHFREPQRWTPALSLDAPIPETDAYFKAVVPRVPAPSAFRMRFGEVRPETPATVHLQPDDDATRAALRGYRDALAEATGIRFPNHDAYEFHITLGYRLIHFEGAAADELASTVSQLNQRLVTRLAPFTLGPPRLVFFEDMAEFKLSR